jgi:hypothetical protein
MDTASFIGIKLNLHVTMHFYFWFFKLFNIFMLQPILKFGSQNSSETIDPGT